MEVYEFDIRGFLGVLKRQARLIAVCVISIVLVVGLVTFALTPIYSASTLILVDPSRKNLLDPEAQMTMSSGDNARIDSEVEILRSDNILLRVIADKSLVSDNEFGVSLSTTDRVLSFFRISQPSLPTGDAALNQTLSKLRNAVTVQRRGSTFLISLSVRSASSAKAADLANTLANAYIADQLQSKINSTLASRNILQASAVEARQAMLQSETAFDGFIQSNIATIVRDSGRSDLASIQAQIEELEQARSNTASLADEAETLLQAGNIGSLAQTLQSEALQELQRQRDELNQTLTETAEGTPTQIDLRNQLAQIDQRLQDQASRDISTLRQSLTADQARETDLREELRTSVLSSSLSADTLTQLYEFRQTAELSRGQYQTLLARIQDLDAQASLQIADSRIVSSALVPNSAAFPNRSLILAVASLVALGIGLALAFLYENALGGFTNEAQLESVLRRRVTTAIPKVRSKEGDAGLSRMIVNSPLSVYSESVRKVKASIEQSLRQRHPDRETRGGMVIMISSTVPGEGKTTVATSLARSYALSGMRTLLIDGDLRKPSVHRQLQVESDVGLLEFLTSPESASIANFLSIDEETRATVLLGARRSGIATDQLISGNDFRRLIKAARASFDVIVIDTPPLGPVVDGLYIAEHADAAVYVVHWASTPQSDVRESVRGLAEALPEGTEILVVLNQQDVNRQSYRQKYGSYYAEYTTP